ncbi:MAG: invasion associated locus B family protein [Pseudomonadota bacterium]
MCVAFCLAGGKSHGQENAPEVTVPWDVICGFENQVAQDPADRCRMAQSLVTGETAEPVILLRVYSTPEPLVLVTVPLNVFLRPGLTLQVDNGRSEVFGFEICNEEGCHSGLPLTQDLLVSFQRGLFARFTYFDATGLEITLPIDLRGFTASWTALNEALQSEE